MTEQEQNNSTTEESWDHLDWELMYNVWHMLPWMERKQMANEYGYSTIGDFEEFMSMKRAMENQDGQKQQSSNEIPQPYSNKAMYEPKSLSNGDSETTINGIDGHYDDRKPPAVKRDGVDSQPDESSDESDNHYSNYSDAHTPPSTSNMMTDEQLWTAGGPFLVIFPEELSHYIFSYLSIDMFATLALVSPHWKYLTRTESIYRKLCERIYLKQSKRRALHVARFGNSYRTMLYTRPRVRNGLYVMKYSKVKKIQRDMWCEIPVGAILETVYYRYILFRENGTVLYALTTAPPTVMIRRFHKVLLGDDTDSSSTVVSGTFTVQGKHVMVQAQQEWQHVQLHMTIIPESHQYGRFGSLAFDRHLTSATGNFNEYAWPNDIHEFEVPHECFNYVPDRRLS